MKPFPRPDSAWRPGETRLHVYALPVRAGQPALLRLIDRAGEVCARFADTNVPVREQWLHATVRMVSLDAREIDAGQRTALVDSLAASVAELSPFTLQVRELVATDAGVLLAFDEAAESDGAWSRMSARVGVAIGRSCGAQALGFDPEPPHVSLTYCSHATDSAPIQEALLAVPHAREPFLVDALHLVDVTEDADEHTYTWRHLARVPLG